MSKPEFAQNIFEVNPHLSHEQFSLFATALVLLLAKEKLTTEVLRPDDLAEWQLYRDNGFPVTRNACSVATLSLAGEYLGNKVLIGYGMVFDNDPITGEFRIGEHYRSYVSTYPRLSFINVDLGDKREPLKTDISHLRLTILDPTYNQFTVGAKYILHRLRSLDQFAGPAHADTLRRAAILAQELRDIM